MTENALYALLASNVFDIQLPSETQRREISKEINDEQNVTSTRQTDETDPETSAVDSHLDIEETLTSRSESQGVSLLQEYIEEFRYVFENLMAGISYAATVYENELLHEISQKLEQKKEELKQYPTEPLWIQYMEMIHMLKTFIKAERTGDWELSVYALQRMLPYLAAAVHNLYLKSVYVYCQSMLQLWDNNRRVYEAFMSGFHVIRRSDRYWAGLSSNLVIEQVLMRSVKTKGGITRGKGMSECQRAQWLLIMPACAAINVAMQTFSGTDFHTSLQPKETRKARIERDYKDSQTFLSFLIERSPFCEVTPLRNIERGLHQNLQ